MKPLILMYHSVAADKPLDPYGVSIKQLEEHIICLMSQGFRFISLADYFQSGTPTSTQSEGKRVVLTFDDGYQDFLINALPVLISYRVPASVFLVVDMLGKTSTWNKYAREAQLMTELEVSRVRAEGMSLGSHTLTHADLTTLDDEELKRQLITSRKMLGDLGEIFFPFSYPWGRYAMREVEAVKAAGYDCAVIASETTGRFRMEPFTLGRLAMHRDMTSKDFERTLIHQRWLKKSTSRILEIIRQVQRKLLLLTQACN